GLSPATRTRVSTPVTAWSVRWLLQSRDITRQETDLLFVLRVPLRMTLVLTRVEGPARKCRIDVREDRPISPHQFSRKTVVVCELHASLPPEGSGDRCQR